ncbi:MAG: hypothetical protein HC888_03495 [Candidatus Competibacteraceae bacterium]|nr:hypothetical protein [Candidatus Competibacteraceae bacterium]
MTWYERRNELHIGMIFRTRHQGIVMLDGYVPGDGTRMYCADRYEGRWIYLHTKPCNPAPWWTSRGGCKRCRVLNAPTRKSAR